ncbi:MAG: hypothetical protein UT05_C0001G0069 [Parcubacteria group bacterium GW2011_GWF2_38_76]|nr:MAG: hypothetical protein UT05_C0001G0069 [Parcubacteria group bacterium GW2011_GWF2_38_76]HBM45954.1 hypothetical protein [Patescibacteria group bacterium]
MILKFSKDLKRQDIYANGDELSSVMGLDRGDKNERIYSYSEDKEKHVALIKNPVLVTDAYKICEFDPTIRDTILKLYESPKRITEYNGVSINFEQLKYRGAWGPSIDTLFFCRGLNKLPRQLSRLKTVIEIGAGSGFISKYLLEKFTNIEKITLVDLNPNSIQCCKDNIKDKRAKFVCGDAIKFLRNKKFDLIICNPPYIPRPGSIDDNPYEGVGLLKYLINNLKNNLNNSGRFISNISSLSEKEVDKTINESGIISKKIDSMTVPLKVCNVLNNKKWLKYLVGRGMKKEPKNGYEYYQDISIVDLTI